MADTDVGKLFVGGISRDTTDVTLRDHFTQYGVVSFSVIAKDRLSGLPRGFGFVTFSDPSSVDKALMESHHLIHGRTVEVKRAIPRKEQQQQPQVQQMPSPVHSQTTKVMARNSDGSYGPNNNNQILKAKKIFVGGLSSTLTEDEFKSYFEKFGKITDVVVMHDNNTNRPRGFGFITFESEEVVDKIMQKSHHELAGKRVEVKRAVPRDATKMLNNGNNPRFGVGRFSHEAGHTTTDGSNWPRGPSHGSHPGHLPVSPAYPGYYYNNGCLYGGAYPISGGYGVLGYGMSVVPLSSPWSGVGMVPARPVNYGTGYYPTGVNSGFPMMGMVTPYGGFMDLGPNGRANNDFRSNGQVHHRNVTPPSNGTRSDGNASSLKTGKGDVNTKKSSRTNEEQAQQNAAPASQTS
ncbi:hypothetical protein RND81_01G103200 [Saponaria officinalis]|uniref:RRM domain-containing protein n=1 Tax=Saponaria officinalis TaxID=3572 RepID=A0AAW1NE48_SAPOF